MTIRRTHNKRICKPGERMNNRPQIAIRCGFGRPNSTGKIVNSNTIFFNLAFVAQLDGFQIPASQMRQTPGFVNNEEITTDVWRNK